MSFFLMMSHLIVKQMSTYAYQSVSEMSLFGNFLFGQFPLMDTF